MPGSVLKLRSVVLLGMLALVACDKGEDSSSAANAAGDAKAGDAKAGDAKAADAKADVVQQKLDEANEKLDEALSYSKDDYNDKKACEIVTPELVSSLYGVPAGELEQMKIMGCSYSWHNADDTEILEARFGSIRIHKTQEVATTWFGNATKGMTPEEVAKTMDDVKDKMKKDGDLDTKPKEKAADHIGGAMMGLAGKEGFRFEKLSGPGDEAALGLSDGIIWIRKGNMTFNVSAYKGKPQPPPTITMGADPKKIIAMATEAQKKFIDETIEQRKTDATKLANAVLAAL